MRNRLDHNKGKEDREKRFQIPMSKHPAIMGPHILKECKEFLPFEGCRVLDPFAGIGTTAKLLPDYDVVGVEIEE